MTPLKAAQLEPRRNRKLIVFLEELLRTREHSVLTEGARQFEVSMSDPCASGVQLAEGLSRGERKRLRPHGWSKLLYGNAPPRTKSHV